MAVEAWSTTPASNNSAPPNGAPEGMQPAAVNDVIRQQMADHATLVRQYPWLKLTTGLTLVRNSNTQFQLTGIDVTAYFPAQRRLREVGASTVYGVVSSSSFSGGNTLVNVSNDAAANIPTSLTAVDVAVEDGNSRYPASLLSLAASQITSGTFADARVAASNVTQHQTSLAIAASQTTSGTFADARIAASNVTQHQALLAINQSQIVGHDKGRFLVLEDTSSGASSLDYTSLTNSGIAFYELEIEELTMGTDVRDLLLRFDFNNGASFDGSAGDYGWTVSGTATTADDRDGAVSDNRIKLNGASSIGNASGRYASGLITIHLGGASSRAHCRWHLQYVSSGGAMCTSQGSGFRLANGTANAVRLIANAGTVSATTRLWANRK